MTINNIEISDALFQQRLSQFRQPKGRFRLPMSKEDAAKALIMDIQAEVEYRHTKFRLVPELQIQVESVAECLTSDNRSFGIMLDGLCGNGKTTLMRAFQHMLNTLQLKYQCGERWERWGIEIHTAREIVDLCNSDYKAYQRLCMKPMLGIDDLGTEPVEMTNYGDVYTPIISLIEKRYAEQLFTIITSNLPPKEIGRHYGERSAEQLSEMMLIVNYENQSFRY